MVNFKDQITNVCGIIFVVCGSISAVAASGVALPLWLTAGALTLAAISGAIIGYFTGKNPNGTQKQNPTNV
jgi:membrane protein DedA with SNARE-associated domain